MELSLMQRLCLDTVHFGTQRSERRTRLHAYKYLAWRFALISLVPAAAYVYAAGWWTGLKVYLVFIVVGQSALAWTYRKDIAQARRNRLR
jgi:CHASE2 domain-containing sensor protein